MNLTQRISAFHKLGEIFLFLSDNKVINPSLEPLKEDAFKAIKQAEIENPWFTQGNILFQLKYWGNLLNKEALTNWLTDYKHSNNPKKVGIVMAGNLPLVGFHDLLCVILSGHCAIIKPSSKDNALFKWILSLLFELDSDFKHVIFEEERLTNIDAVIATGSNNTARYFETYFNHIPNLIRKNRTSVAVLNGQESKEDLEHLGEDIFRFFGLGCRNVTQLLVPKGYNFDSFFDAIYSFNEVMNHHKYMNNHTYYKAIYLMNTDVFLDNNFLLLKESDGLFSPISTLYYSHYEKDEELDQFFNENEEHIQCKVGTNFDVNFGETQYPKLNDYADGVDTIQFLNAI